MKKEWIMTDEEKQKKKQKIEANKVRKFCDRGSTQSPTSPLESSAATANSPPDPNLESPLIQVPPPADAVAGDETTLPRNAESNLNELPGQHSLPDRPPVNLPLQSSSGAVDGFNHKPQAVVIGMVRESDATNDNATKVPKINHKTDVHGRKNSTNSTTSVIHDSCPVQGLLSMDSKGGELLVPGSHETRGLTCPSPYSSTSPCGDIPVVSVNPLLSLSNIASTSRDIVTSDLTQALLSQHSNDSLDQFHFGNESHSVAVGDFSSVHSPDFAASFNMHPLEDHFEHESTISSESSINSYLQSYQNNESFHSKILSDTENLNISTNTHTMTNYSNSVIQEGNNWNKALSLDPSPSVLPQTDNSSSSSSKEGHGTSDGVAPYTELLIKQEPNTSPQHSFISEAMSSSQFVSASICNPSHATCHQVSSESVTDQPTTSGLDDWSDFKVLDALKKIRPGSKNK